MTLDFNRYQRILDQINPIKVNGTVSEIIGLMVEGHGPASSVGEMCNIFANGGGCETLRAEVVGFRKGKVLLMPLDTLQGVGPGCKIVSLGRKASIAVGKKLLGRVIDGLGNPIDGKGPIDLEDEYPLYAEPINPLQRGRIEEPMDLGIRVLNGLLSCGKGREDGHLLRLRRGEKHPHGHDRPLHEGRCERHRAHRRARARGP